MCKPTRSLIVCCLMTLAACGTQPVQPGTRLPPSLPIEQLVDCEPLPPLKDVAPNSLLANHLQLASLYRTCGDRQRALAAWIRALYARD